MRPTEAVVDLSAIARNIAALASFASPAQLCVVVKADAYGHGAVATARVAVESGASWIAVALVEEGIELRRSGLTCPILVLSEPRPGEMFEVVEFGLTPTVYTPTGVAALVAGAAGLPGRVPFDLHLKIDTGMNRVGFRSDQGYDAGDAPGLWRAAVEAIAIKPELSLAGIWTHFAVADELDRPETQRQLNRFDRALAAVADLLDDDVIIHASNSAGLLGHPTARYDMVRVGIATYGIAPARELESVLALEPAMQLQTELGLVKSVSGGESISYGLRHTFVEDTVVGSIPMGYADGLRRSSGELGAHVLVGGVRRPVVGTVTMDQAMVDLGPGSTAVSGDPVVLIGTQGDETITAHEVAEPLGTIPYEIVCDVGRRVRRRYI